MSPTIRKAGLGVSFAAVALPGLAILFATVSALSTSLSSPAFATDYAFAYLAWWLGLAASFVLPGLVAKRGSAALLVVAVAALLVGLGACTWLEWDAAIDPKRIFPSGLFAIPFAGAILFAVLSKNAG